MVKRTQKRPWPEANQACLVAEFARLRNLLDPKADATRLPEAEKIRGAMDAPPAIDQLTQLFGLSRFERDILLLCAGVEMDSKLAALCGEAQGYPQRVHATFGVAMAALPDPHWSALAPTRPLRRFCLVELDGGKGLTSAPLRIELRLKADASVAQRLRDDLRMLLVAIRMARPEIDTAGPETQVSKL